MAEPATVSIVTWKDMVIGPPNQAKFFKTFRRDNPWAKWARDAIVNNVIGAGIVTQWSSPSRQQRWRDWWESTECDADGLTNGYGLQALVMHTLVESGEVLVYRRRRLGPRGLVPLQLQVREPDHLDHTRNESLPEGGRIVQEVQFDA